LTISWRSVVSDRFFLHPKRCSRYTGIFMIAVCSIFLLNNSILAKELDQKSPSYAKTANTLSINPSYSMINIGNWGYWFRMDGKSANQPGKNSGGIYPGGTVGAIYLDGLLWGGLLDGNLRVGGQTYDIGTQPGYINLAGYHVGPDADATVRIYRVRKDYKSVTYGQVLKDAAEQNGVAFGAVSDTMCQEIIDNYAADWAGWPADIGAPYDDIDGDGSYDPDVDIPGIPGADQCAWFVVNDLNEELTSALYGTSPIGIEQQTTIWAYNQPGLALGQSVFKQYRIINKNRDGLDLKEAYISIMSDPDIGDYSDDYIGFDSTTNVGYAYNAFQSDKQYIWFGLFPPSIGYCMIAGPMVPSEKDTAIFNMKEKPGYKNLPLTSFTTYSASDSIFPQPPAGRVAGAYAFYNLMQGFRPDTLFNSHIPFTNDNSLVTKYMYTGDPTTGTGHLDRNPGDRRMVLSSGPFTLAAGDTQDIVVIISGGHFYNHKYSILAMLDNIQFGINNLNNELVTLKTDNDFMLPIKFDLNQNYPNPFNPSTLISYSIQQPGLVNISIYNILGKRIITLENEHKMAGHHELTWDGANNDGIQVGGGVYICQIHTGNKKRSIKMLLLK